MSDYIRFQCEECGFHIKTLEDNSGKVGTCPKCKSKITIPDFLELVEKELQKLNMQGSLDQSGEIDLSKF